MSIRVLRVGAEMGTVVRTVKFPTLNTVEKFYSSHGVPINEDRDWVQNNWYSQRYEIRPEVSSGAEKYYVKEGQKTVNLHYNREPRFYANIGFDRGIYFGNGYNKFPDNVKALRILCERIFRSSFCFRGILLQDTELRKCIVLKRCYDGERL